MADEHDDEKTVPVSFDVPVKLAAEAAIKAAAYGMDLQAYCLRLLLRSVRGAIGMMADDNDSDDDHEL